MSQLITQKERLLVFEAKRWVGMTEIGGDNRGQVVEMFQKAVDGRSSGEPWCLGFVMFCIKMVDDQWDAMMGASTGTHSRLKKTEHCMTLWGSSEQHVILPRPGSLAIWQHWTGEGPTSAGHVGIVSALDALSFNSIEGNTSSAMEVEREGDGVYEKNRTRKGGSRMRLKGFLTVW